MVMPIATFVPGASYAADTFTIPWASLNSTITGNDITAVDSIERLVYALLQILKEKQDAGTISQTNCLMEMSNVGLSYGSVWEMSTNVFSNRDIISFLTSFPLTVSNLTDGDNIA